MKRLFFILTLFLSVIIINRCTIQPDRQPSGELTIRVGLSEKLDNVEFEAVSGYKVFSGNGIFLTSGAAGDRCLVSIQNSSPAVIEYRLLVEAVYDKDVAGRILSETRDKGFPAVIKQERGILFRNGRLGDFICYQVVLEKSFLDRSAAESYQRQINYQLSTRVIELMAQLPVGRVVLKIINSGKTVDSKDYLRIVGQGISLNVDAGTGFHYENNVNRIYGGNINFVIDRYGKLTVVNQLPVDAYLSSVVASEMSEQFPLEALKAQAVTARSFTFSKIGRQHTLSPFDLCDDVHCQVFSGVSKSSQNTDRAVRETKGEVLMYDGEICETFYHGVCGGHTEHNENIWNGTPRRYLRGVFDLPQNNVTVSENFLLQEDNVHRWITESPIVNCNIHRIELPSYLEYTKKYFRWQVEYSQSELSEIIRKKTNHNIGRVLNILPMERGISGRLKKIRVIGSRKSITIEKDLDIRRALSPNHLYSSCFIVESVRDNSGFVRQFIIKGAGWGHGVGMCQTGAAVMALKGANYKKILNHYYRGASIKSVY